METSSPIWAITCYFNPVGYKRKLANYRIFRSHLTIPLVAVELAFDGDFELDPNDAETLIQLRAADVLWHKERLLNIALKAVPSWVENIAWLDCDVVFEDARWVEHLCRALNDFPIVQPFSTLYDLSPQASERGVLQADNGKSRLSLAYRINTGTDAAKLFRTSTSVTLYGSATGHAWAARSEIVREYGFYDAMVLGGGDKLYSAAAYGYLADAMNAYFMAPRQRAHYLRWAEPFSERIQGRVGHVETTLYHLWHGDLRERRYEQRYVDFAEFDFDPGADIRLDENECWRWGTDKPHMHSYVRRYFAARNEDGPRGNVIREGSPRPD